MKKLLRSLFWQIPVLGLTCVGTMLQAQPTGQWDFNSANLSATVGASITYADGAGGATQTGTQFGTTDGFGISRVNGTNAAVMKFQAWNGGKGYLMPAPPSPNGGTVATLANTYTLIMDVLYPSDSTFKIRPLLQSDDGTLSGGSGYLIVATNNGVGPFGKGNGNVDGAYYGNLQSNTWYRLGFVISGEELKGHIFINGAEVGTFNRTELDDRYALVPGSPALILANGVNGKTDAAGVFEAATGYVNSIQLRDVALNPGQMAAIGGPAAAGIPTVIPTVPSFISSRTPGINETGVSPLPAIQAIITPGDATVDTSSMKLLVDGVQVPAGVVTAGGLITVSYTIPSLFDQISTHRVALTYSDTVSGNQTNTWFFTVANYQNVFLPAPIYLETFDTASEGSLPPGWSVTNWTAHQFAGLNLDNPQSDSYLDFVVLSSNRLWTVFSAGIGDARRFSHPYIVKNGVLIDSLLHGNLLYADSDQRQNAGGQVQVAFSPDYDLTGKQNVYLAFNSIYEQNQDDIATVEYSVDQGLTWNPVIYYLDDEGGAADIIRTNGVIDVAATYGTPRGDQAYNLAYSNFIAVAVTTNLIPFTAGRINDDQNDGKRIEVIRLPLADNKPNVRFRIGQAGTSSWYFGIDDFGLYSINTPVIVTQPSSQTIDAGTPVTFSVSASGNPQSYQWKFNGANIVGATGPTYTIANVQPTNAGQYKVIVSNLDGPTPSSVAQLTVVTNPIILTEPLSLVSDPATSVSVSMAARGGRPLTYTWYKNGGVVPGVNTNVLTFASATSSDAGIYQVVVANSYGAVTSQVARVSIFSGSINSNLVVHLAFDGNFNDTSGRGNNATPIGNPPLTTGIIGQAMQFSTLQNGSLFQYATFGYPNDLKFGDSNDFSISMWVNYTNQVDDPPFLSNKDWASSDNRGWGIFTQGGGNFRVNVTGTANKMSSSTTPVVRGNGWHNIVVSFVRGGSAYIYTDGVLVNKTPFTTTGSIDTDNLTFNGSTPYRVNIGQDGRGDYTDGGGAQITDAYVDDLGIWRRALTANEAASIYAQGIQGHDLTTASGTAATPPTVAIQPVSQLISAGGTLNLISGGGGTPPLSYKWQKNAVDAGVTTSNLTIVNMQAAQEGDYRVIISNSAGSVTSSVAQVKVFSGPTSQGMVAHLRFDGNYADSSGHGNNATAVGGPTFSPGKNGQALHVKTTTDGSINRYATLGFPADLRFETNDFSVALWVNYTLSTDDQPLITDKNWDSSSNIGWGLFSQSGGNFRVVATGTPRGSNNRMDTTPGNIIRDGTWHHVLVSFWRGQFASTYVDGQLINSTPLRITGSVDTWDQGYSINLGQDGRGTYTDGGSSSIEALFDDVMLWRRALTPQDVSAVYSSQNSGGEFYVHVGSVSTSGGIVTMTWTGGGGPYVVEKKTALTDPTWSTVTTTSALSATFPGGGGVGFYRVRSAQ